MSAVSIGRSDFERLDRIACANELRVVRAESWARSRAWGGDVAIFDGGTFRFAGNCADTMRAWIHVNGARAALSSYQERRDAYTPAIL